jgi:hypothetical protein
MVLVTRRRSRSAYSVLLRNNGNTIRDHSNRMKLEKLAIIFLILWRRNNVNQALQLRFRNLAIASILSRQWYLRIQILTNPTFNYIPMRLVDHDDTDLYDIRITKRVHIPRILRVLQFPQFFTCDNGIKLDSESALLMWFYWVSSPRLLVAMQRRYGMDYSAISRILKCVWLFIYVTWHHLVIDNIAFFAPRFPEYNACFTRKYCESNNVVVVPVRWRRLALFTDGTKQKVPRDSSTNINFSGCKHCMCLIFV